VGFLFWYTDPMQIDLLDSVEAFIEGLTEKEIAKVIRTIELLEEFENKLGMPHSKHIDAGLFELRIRGKREVRIFYCFSKNKAILLHAFIKKTQKTPVKELNKAMTAKNDLS
jgi:phage-related protein